MSNGSGPDGLRLHGTVINTIQAVVDQEPAPLRDILDRCCAPQYRSCSDITAPTAAKGCRSIGHASVLLDHAAIHPSEPGNRGELPDTR